MKKVELTMTEIWAATRPSIRKNKKKYTRKSKHPAKDSLKTKENSAN